MYYKIILKITISLFFLFYLIFEIDWSSLIDTLMTIKPAYYLISLIIAILNSFILAQKYKVLMAPTNLHQPFLKLVKINFISRFYSMFLSTAIGHGVVRWHKVTKGQNGRSKFISVMIMERITFLFAIFFTTAFSMTIFSGAHQTGIEQKLLPVLWTGLVGLILFFSYFLCLPFHHLTNKALLFANSKMPDAIQKLFGFAKDLSITYKKGHILLAIIFAFIWQILFLGRVYSLFLSLQIPLSFVDVTWMASLVLLVQMLPISFEGIGVRETAYVYLFKIKGLSPESGALIGILFFSQMLFMSFTGGVFELFAKDE